MISIWFLSLPCLNLVGSHVSQAYNAAAVAQQQVAVAQQAVAQQQAVAVAQQQAVAQQVAAAQMAAAQQAQMQQAQVQQAGRMAGFNGILAKHTVVHRNMDKLYCKNMYHLASRIDVFQGSYGPWLFMLAALCIESFRTSVFHDFQAFSETQRSLDPGHGWSRWSR